MLFSLRRSGNLAAGIAVFGILFSLSSPVLADEGVNYTASRVLPVDGEPADQKKSPSDKVLRVAQSAGDSWVVREITAPVRREGTDRAVVVGDRMATGDRLITGPGGQAVLVRRKDKISMSPNSDMKVGDNKGDSLFTDIVQTLGTLLFQVEKNPRQRFRVGTPYLAAIVKGTTFTVSVRPEGAAVHVTDGAVQVAARGSQRAVIVRPGQTGSVSSKPGAEVEIRRREGKSAPSTGESSPSDSAEQADNKSDNGGGQANKAPAKGLAIALGTGPSNFAKLTKGFAGNANANANVNGGKVNSNAGGNSGKANSNADGNRSTRSAISTDASAQRRNAPLSTISFRGNSGQTSNAGGNSASGKSNAGGNSAGGNSAGGNSFRSNSNAGGGASSNSSAGGGGGGGNSSAGGGGASGNSSAGGAVPAATRTQVAAVPAATRTPAATVWPVCLKNLPVRVPMPVVKVKAKISDL